MSRFHALTVTEIIPDTRDSVIVTLKPAPEATDLFRFTQGQYLTFRRDFDGHEVRRCYSICAGTEDGDLKVGIKRVDGGAFSCWANENLKTGDTVEAMPPVGSFFAPIEPESTRFYVGFAGGSGITPILSIMKTVLAREPHSTFTLVYANRQVSSIMFREDLEDLKNRYLGRLQIVHILKSDAQETELFSGRVDEEKVNELLETLIDPQDIDLTFLCGPHGMMDTIRRCLEGHGVEPDRIKHELFKSDQPGRLPEKKRPKTASDKDREADLSLTLDGTTRDIHMEAGETILEAAHRHSVDAPYSCCAGVCSTCRGKLLEGEVEMAANHALEDDEIRDGYILTCQSRPLSKRLVLTYDA
ncbi:MAG: 2Fe-2S iron-sulfur cluster binding domain-containing protein [Roseibium sp.]|uniref:2Fe-2S iron-sulfur cluster-binding protein n=1 Tax=Roseibium sp. TaxID=1936156 RepID=UPI0026173B83|nr:2Fe-2S iron-sulfur cluster-binding protein [Roseibium sp.]MCV0428845.1 2Fe-2S iron-sulfur cluster binding domain-containing protein [Roseibium sp.]